MVDRPEVSKGMSSTSLTIDDWNRMDGQRACPQSAGRAVDTGISAGSKVAVVDARSAMLHSWAGVLSTIGCVLLLPLQDSHAFAFACKASAG